MTQKKDPVADKEINQPEAEEITQQETNQLSVEELTAELEEAQVELALANKTAEDNLDKAMRASAELENVRRRAEKDVIGAHKYALEKFVKELLPVIDSLEKALEIDAEHEGLKAMQDGVELTHKLFLDVIKKFGLEQLDPLDDKFDPELHEAMSMVPHPEAKSQTIIEVFQKGYLLNGRVVRPARVIVAK